MKVVGLTGFRRHGKSTVGERLRGKYSSVVDAEFSDVFIDLTNRWFPNGLDLAGRLSVQEAIQLANQNSHRLAGIVANHTGLDVDASRFLIEDSEASRQLHNRIISYLSEVRAPFPVTRANKVEHTWILQWEGHLGAVASRPDVWARWVDEMVEERVSADTELVTISGIRRPFEVLPVRNRQGTMVRVHDPRKGQDDDHTEKDIDLIPVDTVILNDGSLEQLEAAVDQLNDDLVASSVRSLYVCSAIK